MQAPHAGGFQQRTLADIILQKIQDKERAQGQASTSGYASTLMLTAPYLGCRHFCHQNSLRQSLVDHSGRNGSERLHTPSALVKKCLLKLRLTEIEYDWHGGLMCTEGQGI